MSLETIALIGVLTLLAINLGADFVWLLIVQPALERMGDRTFLETIGSSYGQFSKLMPAVFLGVLSFAVTLNIIASSRTEPYLLRIGLLSFAVYLVLVFVSWKAIAWLRLPAILVAYWSFLHYALNPKVKF